MSAIIGKGIWLGNRGGISWQSYWATRTPTLLNVTSQTDTTIDFAWTAGADEPEGYKLQISTDGVAYTDKATVAGNVTTAQATGLTAGVLYYFKVVAYKGTNESDPTNIYDTRFKITVNTALDGSAADTFILPNYTSGTYDYYVDWGEGGAEEHITTTGTHSHTYAASGTYQIKIRGTMPRIYFTNANDKLKLISIDNWGNIKWAANQAQSYFGCANMNGTYIDVPNWSSVTSLSQYFSNCYLFDWPVPFYTNSVTNMFYTFSSCRIFNQLIPWNTANVTTMDGMLANAYLFNKPLSFNTVKVTTMNTMFNLAYKFNQDVSGFNFKAITSNGLQNFITSSTTLDFSTDNYDLLLISLAAQDVNDSVTLTVKTTYTPGGAAAAARTHLVDTHTWTIEDQGPSFSNGLLVLAFDDGGASQYVAYEDLILQGEKATFYIIGSYPGTGTNLTWAQLQTMQANGMDIQCHSYSHVNFATLTEEQVLSDLSDNSDIFTTNSLPSPAHIAYPYGVTGGYQVAISAVRNTGRTVGSGYVIPGSNKMNLLVYGMDISTDYDALKAAMLIAQNNKWAIITYGHGINGSQIPRAKFNEVIDYAQSIGMSIVTVSEMYALMT